MASILLHKDGVFNVYCTIADGPWFTSGVKEQDLKLALFLEYGKSGLMNYQREWERLLEYGTSSRMSPSIKEVISSNRAGPKEKKMSYDDFVAKFLTITDDYEPYDLSSPVGKHLDEALKENERWV
jgi:hypothetical protein